jgi:LPXTG-site transpeptidase (sortase) family protein
MDTPKKDKNVGWLATGTQPGDIGNAVMAGHVDNRRGAAVFYPLKKLSIGDEIHVMNEQQKQLTFVVNDKKIYRADQAPIKKIFGAAQTANLNLITCTGYFDRKLRTHLDRLVIYATLKK